MNEISLVRIINGLSTNSVLNDSELTHLQEKIFMLLSRRSKLYAGGDTSLSVDDAQQLMESVCFTLEEYLRLRDVPVCALITGDVEDVYDAALASLKSEVASVKRIYDAVSLTAPKIISTSYRDTVRHIGKFIESYDLYYMSHLVPADIDYQLCIPANEAYKGIRYAGDYLGNLYIENRFLRHFDKNKIVSLLHACYIDFASIPLNMFEPVAVNALGLALIGEDVFSLSLDNEARKKIAALINNQDGDFNALFTDAAQRLCSLINFDGKHEKEYLLKTAKMQLARISEGSLNGVFLQF